MATRRPHRRLSLAALLVACGGGADTETDLVGSWIFAPGAMDTLECAGGTRVTDMTNRVFALREGTTTDLETSGLFDPRCEPIGLQIEGPTESVIDGSCNVVDAIISYSITIQLDGDRVTVDARRAYSSEPTGVCTGILIGTAHSR